MPFGRQLHALPNPGMPPVAAVGGYPLIVTTDSLPGATVGVPYSATLTATGGLPPYTWSVISGSLPPGLSLDSAGNITGTPTTAGTFNFTVQVIDPLGNSGSVGIGVSV